MQLRRILTIGVVGTDVKAVKMALQKWRKNVISNQTLVYGEGAARAVALFQKEHDLVRDGVVGQHTLDALAKFFSDEAQALYDKHGELIQPIPKHYEHGHNAIHPTLGLDGYPASDFFAKPGSPVVAMEDALVRRFSGHDPAQGPIDGPHGPLGWSIYLLGHSGTDYYMTHLDHRVVKVDEHVKCGTKLASVANYDKYGTSSHTHVGCHGGSVSITDLMGAGFIQEPL